MKKIYFAKYRAIICLSFIAGFLLLNQYNLSAQTKTSDYVVFGGWTSASNTNSVDMSGATFTAGGMIGSAQNTRTTGSLNLTGSIFSSGRILLSNNNIITGRVTSASGVGTTSLQTGTGLNIGGAVDVNGNIIIGGGVISGQITQLTGSTISPASRPRVLGTPNLPVLPTAASH